MRSSDRPPLRVWPGVVLVALQWFLWFALPVIAPDLLLWGMIGGVVCIVLVLLWWLAFSRARWFERVGVIVLAAVLPALTKPILHASVAGGMMGFMLFVYVGPVLCLALVAAAALGRTWPPGRRVLATVVALALGCAVFALLRTNGITAEAHSDFAWRWSSTSEERLLSASATRPAELVPPSTVESATPPVWPGFRGPGRDGVVHGVRIATDWSATPPVELWRKPVGPGWSSFAVQGDRVYTQEQRGDDEVVMCYDRRTGEPLWRHADRVRFWESNAGAGPRGTPTLHDGRVYSLGATGVLNVLDAGSGEVVWSRDAAVDTAKKVPGWGISGSPLVVDDAVLAGVSGKLAAYDLLTGELRWTGPDGGADYSSPQLATVDGVPQVLFMSSRGVTSFSPADGQVLWEFALPPATRIVQPARIGDGDFLVAEGEGHDLHRILVTRGSGGYAVEERWKTNGLKPYFNDLVVHEGHAYGFDGAILACVDLADGKRAWKGGRYGNGQLVLVADQDLLLVLSEEGELALVSAVPDRFVERGRIPGIHGKTWNHPVLADNVLLARNGEEMAAFRLAAP